MFIGYRYTPKQYLMFQIIQRLVKNLQSRFFFAYNQSFLFIKEFYQIYDFVLYVPVKQSAHFLLRTKNLIKNK